MLTFSPKIVINVGNRRLQGRMVNMKQRSISVPEHRTKHYSYIQPFFGWSPRTMSEGLRVQDTAVSQPGQIQINPSWEAQNTSDGREEFLKQYFQRASMSTGDSKLGWTLH